MVLGNNVFERDQKNVFKRIEDCTEYEGAMPEMDKVVKFWGGIWENDDRTPSMP